MIGIGSVIVGLFMAVTLFSKTEDPHIWLETRDSEQAMAWVEKRNQKSLERLTQDPRYTKTANQIRRILSMEDKLHLTFVSEGSLFRLLQDQKHVQGLLQRKSLDGVIEKASWQTVLDLDELSKAEKTTWVFKGLNCLDRKASHCLIALSRDGRDSSETREFDMTTFSFKKKGFFFAESRSELTWLDENTLLLTSDTIGPKTNSGFGSEIRLWKRGQKPEEAPILKSIPLTSMGIWPGRYESQDGPVFIFIHSFDFYQVDYFLFKNQQTYKLDFPQKSNLRGIFQKKFILDIQQEFKWKGQTFKAGSLIAIGADTSGIQDVKALFTPQVGQSLEDVRVTYEKIYLNVLAQVKPTLYVVTSLDSVAKPYFKEPSQNSLRLVSGDHSRLLLQQEGYNEPPVLRLIEADGKIQLVQQTSSTFQHQNLQIQQLWATSKDGTKIPYDLIMRKGTKLDGLNPTLLYGYGGFLNSLLPFFSNIYGETWLDHGGVFIQANIRGGSEFGPEWHNSAILKNKQKSYDDFIAVAEDLISRKISSPAKLGIFGGSNGGLLVGATVTQRPDLFSAAISANPLLDMIRYPLMPIGATWMGEYGDPEIPEMREVLLKYSPYHNLKKETKYPEIFVMTATSDDRVHPGHARKFAARMEELGIPNLYYENTAGGHGSATIEDQVLTRTLRMIYFYQSLKVAW